MRTIDPQTTEKLKTIHSLMEESKTKIEEAVKRYHLIQLGAYEDIETAVKEFNEYVRMANETIGDEHAKILKSYETRSERWWDTKEGEAYGEFVDAWDGSVEEVDADQPEPLAQPVFEDFSVLLNLPEKPAAVEPEPAEEEISENSEKIA